MRVLSIPLLLSLAACQNVDGKLEELSYGEAFAVVEGGYPELVERAKWVLAQEFRFLDPDRTDEEAGELVSLWRVDKGEFYRTTTRTKGRVKLEDLGDGRVRVGVAVVTQINDNIDNPTLLDEARWVATSRDPETETRIERRIAQRYANFEPSAKYLEKTRDEPRKTLRPDLVDRFRDVDLENVGRIDPDRETPSIVGPESDEEEEE